MGATPAFDVTSVVSTISSVPLSDIGLALLGLAAVAVGFKWIKAMIFG